jgi:hypothetical protein
MSGSFPEWPPEVNDLLGEDPNEIETLDPHIPDGWWEETGFQAATRLMLAQDPATALSQYEGHPRLRAEVRPIEVEGHQVNYLVLFLKDTNETD